MTTFAMALVADVKKQRGNVMEAVKVLASKVVAALDKGDPTTAQAHCAEMFTLLPAVMTADLLLKQALAVDLVDDKAGPSKLIGPMVMFALNHAAVTTEGRKSGAIGSLAHQYQVESLGECARNLLQLRDRFEDMLRKGVPIPVIVAQLFPPDVAAEQPQTEALH